MNIANINNKGMKAMARTTLSTVALLVLSSCVIAVGESEGSGGEESNLSTSGSSVPPGGVDSETGTENDGPKPRPPNESEEEGDGESESESGSEVEIRPELHSPDEAMDMAPEPDIVRVELTAAEHEYEVDGQLVEGYAYNQQVPGPTIRAKKGDKLIVDFQNDLDEPTTIHWHGLHVPFEMDGVTWQGDPVEAGDSFQYTFTLNQSGTYWYHPHVDTERQLDLGLYGVIVVEDPAEPKADRELVAVFDAWGEHVLDRMQDHAHQGLDGIELNWTINGLRDPVFKAKAGEVLRLRTVNVSNAGYLDLAWRNMRLIGSDQGLLPEVSMSDRVRLTNGDRADAELLLDARNVDVNLHPVSINGGDRGMEAQRMMTVETEGSESSPASLPWPFENLEQSDASPDPAYTDIHYTLHGDPHTGEWLINGEAFPDITIEEIDFGQQAIVEIRNLSSTEHPFHLHGLAFEVLSVNHIPSESYTLEDTFNIGIRETVRIKVHANNPGDWMTHCHILPHVEGGMMTVLRVKDAP